MGYQRADGRSGFERVSDESAFQRVKDLLGDTRVVVPNVVGGGVTGAHQMIRDAGLVPAGGVQGETVTSQDPTGGARAERGSTVTLTSVRTELPDQPQGDRATARPNAPAAISGLNWRTIFLDDFVGTSLDRTKWREHPDKSSGYSFDAYYPIPAGPDTLEVGTFHGASALRLKARRDPNVPSTLKWKTSEIFTLPGSRHSPGWLSPKPAAAHEFYEFRVRCQGGFGTSEQAWGLGPGQWPVNGEWDFMEMFNLDEGWLGIPHFSLHWPKDVYTNPPGTWLNDYHIGKAYRDPAGPLTLLNRWITIGAYRNRDIIKGYVNGTHYVDYHRGQSFNTSMPIPGIMFDGPMGLIIGLGVGGYQGSGKPESQWQESDYYVDYAQVWAA